MLKALLIAVCLLALPAVAAENPDHHAAVHASPSSYASAEMPSVEFHAPAAELQLHELDADCAGDAPCFAVEVLAVAPKDTVTTSRSRARCDAAYLRFVQFNANRSTPALWQKSGRFTNADC